MSINTETREQLYEQYDKLAQSQEELIAKIELKKELIQKLRDEFSVVKIGMELGQNQADEAFKLEQRIIKEEKSITELQITSTAKQGAINVLSKRIEELNYDCKADQLNEYLSLMQTEINEVKSLETVILVLQQKLQNINSIGKDILIKIIKTTHLYDGAARSFRNIPENTSGITLQKINNYIDMVQNNITDTLERMQNEIKI